MTAQVTHTPTRRTDHDHDRADLEALADGERVVLNLGCGQDGSGIGIDIHYEPDIKWDLNDGIPVADSAADEILCRHVLEHLAAPAQLLDECRRVLRDDGVLKLEVPNVGWLPVRLWITQDPHSFWAHKNPDRDGHWLARRLGTDDERRTAHRSLWTPALLGEHLDRVGFEYDISGRHWSRNLHVRATPDTGRVTGQTLHELERDGGQLASGDYWAQTRARIMEEWVQEFDPSTVLDVGCGSGYLTARIASQPATDRVVGVDANAESARAAQRRDTTAEFRVGDAFSLAACDNAYECVIFGDVLEHFGDPGAALAEGRRVLTPDGQVIVSLPAYRWLYGPHDEHNDHEDRYTRGRLAALAGDAGFDLERTRYANLLPLVPYALYQRVLQRPIPSTARGGHNGLVEWIKQRCIDLEASVSLPAGVTLLGVLEPA